MKDGALPTRGVSSYRRLQKPEAWALRAYASFFVFTAEAALWECPARTNHASLGGRRFLLGSDDIHGPRSGSAPPRTNRASLGGRRFVEFGRRLEVTYCQ